MLQRSDRPPLTLDEAARLCGACRTLREMRVIWLLLDTGLRLDELAVLSKDGIDIEGGCLNVGKPHDRRAIPLTARTTSLLSPWFEQNETFGLCTRSIQRTIRAVGERAGISHVSAGILRGTFAVTAPANGTSLQELRRLMGFRHLAAVEAFFELARQRADSQHGEEHGWASDESPRL
jgi:site-specific recombinase XerD